MCVCVCLSPSLSLSVFVCVCVYISMPLYAKRLAYLGLLTKRRHIWACHNFISDPAGGPANAADSCRRRHLLGSLCSEVQYKGPNNSISALTIVVVR